MHSMTIPSITFGYELHGNGIRQMYEIVHPPRGKHQKMTKGTATKMYHKGLQEYDYSFWTE